LDALGINLGYLLVQIFAFAILFIILKAWVYTPLVDMLENRREMIAKGLEDANVAAEARANAEAKADTILNEAQAKASEVVREGSTKAEDAVKDIKIAAEAEATEIKKKAVEEAVKEREALLGEVRGQVAALAMAATQKLLGEALDEKRQHVLIDEFFSGIKGDKVVVEIAEGDAVVTSALPLTDAEKSNLTETLKGSVEYKVDPSILGGLVIKVGDKVLDSSIAGKLESMRQSLK
jgi:F-type H+-transporting ATPase subunit b